MSGLVFGNILLVSVATQPLPWIEWPRTTTTTTTDFFSRSTNSRFITRPYNPIVTFFSQCGKTESSFKKSHGCHTRPSKVEGNNNGSPYSPHAKKPPSIQLCKVSSSSLWQPSTFTSQWFCQAFGTDRPPSTFTTEIYPSKAHIFAQHFYRKEITQGIISSPS